MGPLRVWCVCWSLGASLLLGLLHGCSSQARAAPPADRGASLFARHCAGCHGARGAADTEIAGLMTPRPRAFADGVFKLVSTQNGVPALADLERSIRRGMPGSAMPGYEWLAAEDLTAVAAHVRELAIAGVAARLQTNARVFGQQLADADARAAAERRLTPGPTVVVPPPAPDRAGLGQILYQQHCAACHGVDGRGRQPTLDWAGAHELAWARDFTVGFLRGEPSATELAYRIRAGMPGAHMPPTRLGDEELAALIAWVQTLIPDGADRQHLQWRHHLQVPRLPTLPATPADWERLEAVRLPMAPLRWRVDAVFEAEVRFAHDGKRLAAQIRWYDDTRDDKLGNAPQGDGVALQFTTAQDPPLFAMGGDDTVAMWHWKAFRRQDMAGVLDLLGSQRGLDVPEAIPGFSGPSRTAESLLVHGPTDMGQQRGSGTTWPVQPQWHDRHWTIAMTRDLTARSEQDLSLPIGEPLLVALAIWNGSIDAHPGSKSVTTWHRLELQR
ncbi:MAG: c-type cytochrome [Planctomycetes bacterium]|nr:c-type cytochrome [Planctomycetota bacterium]